jgi:hypothetical protein
MLFDAHTRSFAALGGVPRRGIYDNMKTAVDKVNKGKGRIVNARFAVMCAHYLFDADFCNVASGWEKGVVEKNVQDSRRRIWLDAQSRKFGSFAELNAWLGERCRSRTTAISWRPATIRTASSTAPWRRSRASKRVSKHARVAKQYRLTTRSESARAGKSATGYALRSFPRAFRLRG